MFLHIIFAITYVSAISFSKFKVEDGKEMVGFKTKHHNKKFVLRKPGKKPIPCRTITEKKKLWVELPEGKNNSDDELGILNDKGEPTISYALKGLGIRGHKAQSNSDKAGSGKDGSKDKDGEGSNKSDSKSKDKKSSDSNSAMGLVALPAVAIMFTFLTVF
ncbi:hypothetical protein TUBRATIS_008550 [Tubulinosema ratisbonensis]|uniref:Uncharacterized protein n=1 Tax=Tubulinosema ratisbonensis TaxID=291195 RepID=A0A437ANM8_9MICR|nr:hypothetical protein TUBRATIS_008550 [Tubulinosema ratisbonensis]